MNIKFSPPDITEEEILEVADTLRSGWLTTGPKTKLLEKQFADYCESKRFVCLNSATAAMELTLRLFGIGEGDEIVTTAYTYTASAAVICHVGAKPIIIDTAKDSLEMDYEQLERALTHKTKAVIPVDMAGIICDYSKIIEILERNKKIFTPDNDMQASLGRVLIMADAAHSFGSVKNGLKSGRHADFSCFSFHAIKNLAMGEGGGVTWNELDGVSSDDIYNKYMLLSLHGQNKDALSKTQLGGWEYDILFPGYKCNLTDIMSSIGLVQLKRYPDLLRRRKEIVKIYDEIIKSDMFGTLEHEGKNFESNRHLYLVRILGKDEEYRNNVIVRLAEKGIPTNVHFKPLPMFTAYKNLGYNIEDFPNAYNMYKNVITLPLHTCLTEEDVLFIAENFVATVQGEK